MKRTLQTIAYKCVYGLAYAASLIPMAGLYALASFSFFLLYRLIGYRKAVVIQNVSRSFPEMNYREVRCIVRMFYARFTAYFAEIIKSLSVSAETLDEKIRFENLDWIDKHISEGRNVIACLGHCGNWEMLNFMPSKLRHDMYAVYKPLRSGIINRLMIKLRSRFGMKLISNKSVIRHIRTQQSAPAVYLFLADQCPRTKEEKYRFTLLNQKTYLFSGMEKLARISRSAVVYLHIVQVSKGRYNIKCLPICSGEGAANEGEITQRYVDLLTENIKDDPPGWLWSHKRWKR